MFMVSLSVLILFLGEDFASNQHLEANVVDSISIKSHQEEENKYREIVENKEDPVVVLGLDGAVEFTSWDFEPATGYAPEEIENNLYYDLINPDDLAMFIEAVGKAIESQEPMSMVGPFRFRDADDEYKFHMASIYPTVEDGRVTSIAITFKDISESIQEGTADEEEEDIDEIEVTIEEIDNTEVKSEQSNDALTETIEETIEENIVEESTEDEVIQPELEIIPGKEPKVHPKEENPGNNDRNDDEEEDDDKDKKEKKNNGNRLMVSAFIYDFFSSPLFLWD